MKTNRISLPSIAACVAIAMATVTAPFGGAVLAEREQGAIVGGQCQVQNFVACFYPTIANSNVCGACFADQSCSSSNASEQCSPIQGPTAPGDCISCGTCNNDCGGQYMNWTGPKCTGSFTFGVKCGTTWVDAQKGACAQACPGS